MSTNQYTGLHLICVSRLPDYKVTSKIRPLIVSDLVERIYLVRRTSYSAPKVVCYSPPSWMQKSVLLTELYRLLTILYLCATRDVHALIGFGLVLHGLYVAFAGRLFRKPYIQLILGKVEFTIFEQLPYGHNLLDFAIRDANFIGVRGENTKAKLRQEGLPVERLFIPHNVFEFSDFQPTSLSKEFDIINVGRLESFRRIDILLQVIAKLREQREQLRVIIIGGGWTSDREMKRLQQLSRQLDLEQIVQFAGTIDHDKVVEYLNRSRLFFMTSEGDGMPMAMIEAMACGLPCVVPDDADITTVAKHEHNSLVVSLGDIDGFVSAINRLLDDDVLYNKLSNRALQLRSEKALDYSLNAVQRIWEKVLVQLPGAPHLARSTVNGSTGN